MSKARKKGAKIELALEIEVRDKDGKLIEKRRQPCGSWVANFLRFLRRMFGTEGIVTTASSQWIAITGVEPTDITNVARSVCDGLGPASAVPIDKPVCKIDAPAGAVDCGTKVGTGDTAVTPLDYNLVSPIAHGSGVGQLSYGATTLDTIDIVGNTVKLRIIRTFTNLSGAGITVREIGLFARFLYSITSPYYTTTMFARDVLVAPVTVPNGSTLTVRYILSTTA